jgi:hypothetical protein
MNDTTKTVRVRALVFVDPDGKWTVMGDGQAPESQVIQWAADASGNLGGPPWGEYWIEATVPVPVQPADGIIEAEITDV